MKAQISRESHRPSLRYSGVYHNQGAMVTDADLDERSEIDRMRTDNLGNDTVRDGVPAVGGAVAIAADGAVSLREGIIYADGVRGVLAASEEASLNKPLAIMTQQADLPVPPALPAGDLVIYADIWERPVFPLEDPYLADAGLHGAVTGFRTRTMTQLKAAPAANEADIENGTGAFPQIGTAKLSVTPLNAEILADECDPCAEVVSAEQVIANALWRLEVVGITGTPDKPGQIALAWSEENAAEIAAADVSPEAFERANKVYEFFSPITESHAGVFANAADSKRSAFVDDLSATPSPPTDHNGEDWPFVRRWDGFAAFNTANGNAISKLGGGFDISMAGSKITLRVTSFEAVLDIGAAAVVRGDYWLVELRSLRARGRTDPPGERDAGRHPAPLLHAGDRQWRDDQGTDGRAPPQAVLSRAAGPACRPCRLRQQLRQAVRHGGKRPGGARQSLLDLGRRYRFHVELSRSLRRRQDRTGSAGRAVQYRLLGAGALPPHVRLGRGVRHRSETAEEVHWPDLDHARLLSRSVGQVHQVRGREELRPFDA